VPLRLFYLEAVLFILVFNKSHYNISFTPLEDNTIHTGYFTDNNEPGGIENTTHNTNVYRIVLRVKWNYESMTALVPIILFVATDIYEKVKNETTTIKKQETRVITDVFERRDMILIYGECNKNASAVARFCRQ
jgi:hypothetical protein